MKRSDRTSNQIRSFPARLGASLALLLGLALLLAAPASATYEQVGTFRGELLGEGASALSQLSLAEAMAVNFTGAGGVFPGTVYVARPEFVRGEIKHGGLPTYSAKGEFLGEIGDFEKPTPPNTFSTPIAIAVDQATGNVYVLLSGTNEGEGVVRVYSADGSQVIAEFGERGAFNETTDEGPGKIHGPERSGIAVDGSGVVYVSDKNGGGSRVMVFKPQSPGDYEHYVYAGRANDVAPGYDPGPLALDSGGDVYLVGGEEKAIYRFSPGDPAAPACEYQLPAGGIEGMTINPASGEVFYFSYKNTTIHQLSACNPQGEFPDAGSFKPLPKASDIYALAFNPTFAWEASRPAGVLYGAVEAEPGLGYVFAPAEVLPPLVESESVSSVATSTATLAAQINPKGSPTRYAFQYIPELAWQQNQPDEVQELTVAAEAGTYALTTTTATGAGKINSNGAITGVSTDLGAFRVGDLISGPGIPPGTTITQVAPDSRALSLSQSATETALVSLTATETTAPIAFNAPATGPQSVQAALNSLPGIATDQVTSTGATVSGGPGDAAGSAPYTITFSGTDLGGADVPQMSADSASLSGADHTASLTTLHDGGGGFSAGASEAPLGGAALGSGQQPLSAAASLLGLAPDATYHYRVIATSHCNPDDEEELCEDVGPDRAFHTFPAQPPGLPDNRDYELVSPAQKHGGQVFPANPLIASCGPECKPGAIRGFGVPMQSSPDGDAVVYEGFPFSFTEGAAVYNEYLSRRTASGWQTTILSPLLHFADGYRGFDAGLTQGVLFQNGPVLSPEAPPGYPNLYTQPTAVPTSLTPLIKAEPHHALQVSYAGASADFTRLFFEATDSFTGETPYAPAAVDAGAQTYNLYESTGDELRLVNVLPGNTGTAPGAEFGSGKQLKSGSGNNIVSDYSHAISDDGSRVFWSSANGQVYVRENGELTREVPDHLGRFLTASSDGGKLLLDDGDVYDLESGTTVDLTEGNGGFQGIVGQSEDLSHIYFVDTAVLDDDESELGATPQVGKDNLYAWDEGISTFVATLDPADNPSGSTFVTGDWFASPAIRSAEASPDGRWLAFLSRAPLTGDPNTFGGGGECEPQQGPACPEVFLYDSATGSLTCPSCNPIGAHPLGASHLGQVYLAEGSLPQLRYLTDSGRLYFDSRDSLSPFDTNAGVEDVYQYEPEGVGDCQREAGCVSLISAGHEPVDSNFLAADSSGQNVFFTTRDQLVLKDRDDLVDLYDAREGGGIPAETETGRGECQGEACQPQVSPPNDPTPGSSGFEGAGNVKEKGARPCPTGKVKKKGKCVKKHRRKKYHPRRAGHDRGGSK